MKIINIVDNATPVNTGIWNAAVSTAKALKEIYDVDSELWYPKMDEELSVPFCTPLALDNIKVECINDLIQKRSLSPNNVIIVTHGCWRYPTKWGSKFKSLGYKWVYVPQGMLEPWSLLQKRWIKFFYFNLIERLNAKRADIVRAVASPEKKNLTILFKSVMLIPNGVLVPEKKEIFKKKRAPLVFLFMARLHHKKGIVPLTEAWKLSKAYNHPDYKLIIAGPDHGELKKIQPFIRSIKNVQYVGMVAGSKKQLLLSECTYFILPSFSEGFPTSVVEAMSYGMVPLISKGCNFPEAIEYKYAIEISTEPDFIAEKINLTIKNSEEYLLEQVEKNYYYISENYSLEKIAEMQFNMYEKLLAAF